MRLSDKKLIPILFLCIIHKNNSLSQGVMARVYETVTVLCLLGTLVLGMTYVLSALIDYQKSSLHTLLSKYTKSVTLSSRRNQIIFITLYILQIYGVIICLSFILVFHSLELLCYYVSYIKPL